MIAVDHLLPKAVSEIEKIALKDQMPNLCRTRKIVIHRKKESRTYIAY
jgi:hypothetical protein